MLYLPLGILASSNPFSALLRCEEEKEKKYGEKNFLNQKKKNSRHEMSGGGDKKNGENIYFLLIRVFMFFSSIFYDRTHKTQHKYEDNARSATTAFIMN